MLRRCIQTYPIASFYLLAVGIVAWVVWLRSTLTSDPSGWLSPLLEFLSEHQTYANLISIARYAFSEDPLAWSVFIFASAPTVAALIVTLCGWGRGAVANLVGRLRPWRDGVTTRRGLVIYLAMAGVYLAIAGSYLLATYQQAGADRFQDTYAILGGSPLAAMATLLLGALVDEGGTLEELGWRGYALPRLCERMHPLAASAVLGTLWMAWHFPREVPALVEGTAQLGPLLKGQAQFLLLTVLMSIVITFLFYQTGGSALPGILVHGGTNVWSKALGGPLWEAWGYDLRSLIVAILAMLILLIAGPRLGAPAVDASAGY